MQILHILSHLGGGVGRVLFAYLREELKMGINTHKVFCLEKVNNPVESFDDLQHLITYDKIFLNSWVETSDIVVMHYYNHPLLFDLIINHPLPKCRLVAYSHNSNLHAPYIHSKKLINFFDKFVFTTGASFQAKEFDGFNKQQKDKLVTIESAFGSENIKDVSIEKPKEAFIVGYIGTASYSKLNKDFVEMCSLVKSPVKFIVCSGDKNQEHLKQDAIKFNMQNKIEFKGRVDDVIPYLRQFNVLGYPLHPQHNFSAEQALGEAMLFGCIPVVLNNPAEKHIVDHNVNGIIVNNKYEYAKAIDFLYECDASIRERLSKNANKFSLERYSIINNINAWNILFKEVIRKGKKKRVWNKKLNLPVSSTTIFIEALGDEGKLFKTYLKAKNYKIRNLNKVTNKLKELFRENIQWRMEKKAGIQQYLYYFPDDTNLIEWNKLLKESFDD